MKTLMYLVFNLEKKSPQVPSTVSVLAKNKWTIIDWFHVLDMESRSSRLFDHDPFNCFVPRWQLLENWNNLFHNPDPHIVQYDFISNPPVTCTHNCLCRRVSFVLHCLSGFFEETHESFRNLIHWLSLHLSYHSDFVGASPGLEVLIFFIQTHQKKVLPKWLLKGDEKCEKEFHR